jgi:hypothetical protein
VLREEHKLKAFENRVLRRVEVAGGWRRLHNEKLHNLYTSPDIIRVIKSKRMRWVGHVACMGEIRNAYNILVGKPEGKKPHGRHRHKWEYNVRMGLREIVWEGMDWMHLAQDRDQWQALVNVVMNLGIL